MAEVKNTFGGGPLRIGLRAPMAQSHTSSCIDKQCLTGFAVFVAFTGFLGFLGAGLYGP